MRITLRSLEYFLAAVQHGSLSAAGRELHVSPSAVLAGVNQVEEGLGVTLTTRHRSRGVTLTPTGHSLLPRIQHLIDEYESLIREGTDARNGLSGTLRIGYYAPVAPAFMPALVSALRAQGPSVEIKLYACDNETAQAGLVAGDYDVIICLAEAMRPEIHVETLLDVPAYVLCGAEHPFARRAAVSIGDLADQPLVLLDLPQVRDYYAYVLADAGVSPSIAATTTSLEMLRSLVASGLGCSLLHMRPLTDTTYAGGTLAYVPLDPAVQPLRIALGHLAANPRRLLQAFLDECRRYFDSDRGQQLLGPALGQETHG